MVLKFQAKKETSGSFQFHEVTGISGEPPTIEAPKIGTLYVRKTTLRELGWTPGQELTVTIEV